MIRKIIRIEEDKCDGCGLCVTACHEGAIDMVDGKAKLVRENFCDGLGDCLPQCPTGAITFENREAPEYDEEAVKENQKKLKEEGKNMGEKTKSFQGGCPGSMAMSFKLNREVKQKVVAEGKEVEREDSSHGKSVSRLEQWPVQIKLVPTKGEFFDGAKLLIAADCSAYAYANMHEDFMKGKVTLIGCPKLDEVDYSRKLTEIIESNDIKSVTVVRMEVPCCGGLQMATENALKNSGKFIPWQIVTISRDGKILD